MLSPQFLARIWHWQGIAVHHLHGTAKFVPADVAILHVDLSVVPDAYASFARRYPVALNAGVLDIRKRRFSTLAVTPADPYAGPVIVKTDLNSGGGPERLARRLGSRDDRPAHARGRITGPFKYRLYPTSADVPPAFYRDPGLIIEKFVPERQGDWYCHRRYYFLGATEVNQLWRGKKPLCVNDEDGIAEDAPVPPQLRQFRQQFGIDFGKIDYVFASSAEPIVLDVNKTPWGVSPNPADRPWLRQLSRSLHRGIHALLPSAARIQAHGTSD